MAEAGEPLTRRARSRTMYRKLLEAYFGPDFAIDDELSLECFRIPHFYRAFYVYKYATGLSAAIALSERVLNGGKPELDDYLRSSKAAARSTRSICSATPASTWRSPSRSIRRWPTLSGWSRSWTSWCSCSICLRTPAAGRHNAAVRLFAMGASSHAKQSHHRRKVSGRVARGSAPGDRGRAPGDPREPRPGLSRKACSTA